MSQASYPNNAFKQIKFAIRSIYYYRSLKHLHTFMNSQVSKLIMDKHPEFLTKSMRPYLALGLKRKSAMEMIVSHHNWMNTNNLMDVYKQGVSIANVKLGEEELHFVLSYEPRYWKEGELTLRLTNFDENFYVLSFTIFNNVAYVGGVQGPERDHGFSKKLTKSLFGLRPKSLILEVLRLWLANNSIDAILGVKNKQHTYASIRYASIQFDFDTFWSEHGGTVFDMHFYQIPLVQPRKDLAALSRSKRKMYNKRYEFLDALQLHHIPL
ncbi:VirK/YbjX family protein [Vibrio sp. S4M6]|nr:DUF535 family protein [Vibrio sinus]MCL9780998.1 VirK/YbjX family protein [Vibrio sinus]